jgi:hypothetical protein
MLVGVDFLLSAGCPQFAIVQRYAGVAQLVER